MANNMTRASLGNVLTQDEARINDFVQTRMRKVLGDLEELAGEGSEDIIAWTSAFSYLAKTYGRDSDEAFKWYKYFLRQGRIPPSVQLPLLMQIYDEGALDGGFVNALARAMKLQPVRDRERYIRAMKKELENNFDEDGMLCLYRGSYTHPFRSKDAGSRPIERAFAFTLDESVAERYAVYRYPEIAKVYTVKVPVEDVARYNLYMEDKTVVVLPISKGGALRVISERLIDPSEYGGGEKGGSSFQ